MAISRHDPEWHRVVAMAALTGVPITKMSASASGRSGRPARWSFWQATIDGVILQCSTRYELCVAIITHMGADASILPDAATPQTAPPGSGGNRTEEFKV